MIKQLLLSISILLIFNSCTQIVTGRTSCLYLQDLSNEPNGFLEWQFSLDKNKEINDSCKNCYAIKITNDIDWWGSEFYSKDTIPDSYFLIHPRDRKEFEKKNGFHNCGRWIGSGRSKIQKIDILKNDNVITIKSVDYNEYTWGSRNIYFQSIRDGTVPMRIITELDTFYTLLKIQNGKLELGRDCIRDKLKRKKGVDMNPFNWPLMIMMQFKGSEVNINENEKNKNK